MGEFFKYFGIAMAVLVADIFICVVTDLATGFTDDNSNLIPPLILNGFAFVTVTAILIGERMG